MYKDETPRYIDYEKVKQDNSFINFKLYEVNKVLPIYITLLYIPEFNVKQFLNHNYKVPPEDLEATIKKVCLPGWGYRKGTYIYTEYLNLDGYLEKRVYDTYEYPEIYLRS
jgi:hypothetical protein